MIRMTVLSPTLTNMFGMATSEVFGKNMTVEYIALHSLVIRCVGSRPPPGRRSAGGAYTSGDEWEMAMAQSGTGSQSPQNGSFQRGSSIGVT